MPAHLCSTCYSHTVLLCQLCFTEAVKPSQTYCFFNLAGQIMQASFTWVPCSNDTAHLFNLALTKAVWDRSWSLSSSQQIRYSSTVPQNHQVNAWLHWFPQKAWNRVFVLLIKCDWRLKAVTLNRLILWNLICPKAWSLFQAYWILFNIWATVIYKMTTWSCQIWFLDYI